jgi:hypothetical protein
MTIFGWRSKWWTNTDGTTINYSKDIMGISWWGRFRLIGYWGIHVNITARCAHELGFDVEDMITLNVLHELSHLATPGAKTGDHGDGKSLSLEQKVAILKWNKFLSKKLGFGKMALHYFAQLLWLSDEVLAERTKNNPTFTFPDVIGDLL